MNGAGGNSTRLVFDDDDDFNDGTPLCSIMFSVSALILVLIVFKIIYERWVTPLSSVPGKFLHSVTSIPMRYHMLRGTLPVFLLALHKEFGPVVRISPQRVSVGDVDMVKHVLGSHSFGKTPSYDMPRVLEPNAFSTRSPDLSQERRRQLAPGFSHRHLLHMEDRIVQCGVSNVDEKLNRICGEKGGGGVVQYNRWFSLIALDTIGVLGFGRKFGALENETHELVPTLVRIRMFSYITMALPWLKLVPSLLGRRLTPLTKLMDFAWQAIAQRRKENNSVVDLLELMMTTDDGLASVGEKRMSDPQIVSETILHLIAGVDTTSAGLTWTMALLLHNPKVMQRLVAEIRGHFPPPSSSAHISFEECRQRLPYLSAVIHESLRVLSPAPGMLPRLAPAGGLRLGGYYLPAGTWICCTIGAVHMNPSAFTDPEVFNPDRFLVGETNSSERFNMLAFSTGVRACLGRNLALVEMHVVLANLLRSWDVRLPAGALPRTTCGGIPEIPRSTMMTMNPDYPDRDCLMVVSPAAAL
ncbi:hypothetical protein IWW38_004460 [Coemansia aciculifera]|uniref:Uncharacterized protein n=1 Tax=Coemansia aciculifera TaxID=417176 RepID=A0ACC1LZD8_9FUNG|nr:hypothetical protein IWW38_004460 [Coemansia aciculifera]